MAKVTAFIVKGNLNNYLYRLTIKIKSVRYNILRQIYYKIMLNILAVFTTNITIMTVNKLFKKSYLIFFDRI